MNALILAAALMAAPPNATMYVLAPPIVIPQVYAIPVQVVPVYPYVYRQRYPTPLRDLLFGKWRTGWYVPVQR